MTKKEWIKQASDKYKEISDFIKEWGIPCNDNEPDYYTELMCDDHKCIIWKGTAYYIPESKSSYSNEEYSILDYLVENHNM